MKQAIRFLLYDWEVNTFYRRLVAPVGFVVYGVQRVVELFTADPTFGPSGITRRGK